MDLSTTWLGLALPHPFVAGASPLADSVAQARQAEDGGVAAIVLRSLFEEQIDAEALAHHRAIETHTESFGEATSFLPDVEEVVFGPDEYLDHLRRIKNAVDVPVIGSLNGYTPGGWLDYARQIESAGADALELNLYMVATDPTQSAQQLEDDATAMVRTVKGALRIPVAVKLSPFYTSLGHFAQQLVDAGADGLVLFNRFFETDVDLEELEVRTHLELSTSHELLLRLRWLAILSPQLRTSFAVSGGVHRVQDALKALLCGADAIQLVSLLLRRGPDVTIDLLRDLDRWLEGHEYTSLAQLRGSMNHHRAPDPKAFERANYMKILRTWGGS